MGVELTTRVAIGNVDLGSVPEARDLDVERGLDELPGLSVCVRERVTLEAHVCGVDGAVGNESKGCQRASRKGAVSS